MCSKLKELGDLTVLHTPEITGSSRRAYRSLRVSGPDTKLLVRMKGLEPPLPRGNWNLNPARLPISPHPQNVDIYEFSTFEVKRTVVVPHPVL